MKRTSVQLPDGARAIVCSGRRRAKACRCGRPSTRLCDWRIAVPAAEGGPAARVTCDAPLCDSCTHSPAPGKDLCPSHAEEWQKLLHKRSEVMNPPVSAAEGTEAGNLNTEPWHRTGAVLQGRKG